MKVKTNELMIGVFVFTATLIVIFSILWLGRSNFFVKGLHVNLIVPDAQGLNVGDQVFYRGLSVGSVQSAELADRGILLKLKIERAAQIPKDSKFSIKEENLLGGKGVEIQPGRSTEYLENGDVVHGKSSSGLMNVVQNSKKMETRINKVLANIDSLTGAKTFTSIHSSLNALNSTIKDARILLEQNRKDLSSLIANLNAMSAENREPLHSVITTLSKKSEALSDAITRTRAVSGRMDSILNNLQAGQGSMGKLFTNDSLYNNMNRSFAQLDSLLQDIRKNPEKYFKVNIF
ncbi:MAG: MCE family protein [Calditrichaeota bacterium]|nr:MCE family protein [Calditrichota bacterium]